MRLAGGVRVLSGTSVQRDTTSGLTERCLRQLRASRIGGEGRQPAASRLRSQPGTRVSERLPQLLQYPFRCRMRGDIKVQYIAATVLDHEKAVQQPKRHRPHCEELKGDDGFSMVRQERTPSAGRVPAASASPFQESREGGPRRSNARTRQ